MRQLMTRWTEEVLNNPEKVWKEYPRPSMVRESFVNLNGWWEYAFTKEVKPPAKFRGKILVPFSPEALLSGVKRQLKPGEVLWYRRLLPEGVKALDGTEKNSRGHWLLHFGAVDQFAAVYINRKLVCRHLGGYLPFSADVTEELTEGENELLVAVKDFTDRSYFSRGKQKLQNGGMFYTAQSGIWQTVWMEQVPEVYIGGLKVTPLFDERQVEVTVSAAGGNRNRESEVKTEVTVSSPDMQPMTVEGRAGEKIRIPVTCMNSWSPESPYLYDMQVTMGEDRADSYFAMRKIAVEKDGEGIPRLFLNNRPYFQKGVLDQGYWPDGLYTAPCDEAFVFDIMEMNRLGFNMLRKHIKIEPERWYYHCDRLGMLVWQDMVCGGRPYRHWYVTYMATAMELFRIRPGDHMYRLLGRKEEKGRRQFLDEMKAAIQTLYNHPSIVTWVLFNEGWGQFDAKEAVRVARREDPLRLLDQASGWFDQGGGDIRSIHNYFFPLKVRKEERVAALTEFGGYCWRNREHSMYAKVYGYRIYQGRKELTKGYSELMEREVVPNIPKGLSASIYTQLSDIEEEVNGIYTYDREEIKIEEEVLKEWNKKMKLPEENSL